MTTVRVVVRDRGLQALMRDMKDVGELSVRVGVLDNTTHVDPRTGAPTTTTIADIATWNEYGTERIPSRPAFRRAINENTEAIGARLRTELRRVVENQQSPNRAMARVGLFLQALIRQSITDLRDPPNAPSTIARKGSDNPLVDSGQMRQAVTFDVVRRTQRSELS